MTNSNRIKLTWINFPSYAPTGTLVIITEIVMGNITDHFDLPISSMSSTFTFLNASISVSVSLNAWLMEIVPLKTQLRFGFLLMVPAVADLMSGHSLALFSTAMLIPGVISGVTISIDTSLITRMYEGCQCDSHLLFTDSFFNMTGMVFPMITAFLLACSIEWYWAYVCIRPVYVAISILTFGCEFSALGRHAPKTGASAEKEKQEVGILFPSVTALYYILGQLGFISWMPEYTKDLGMSLSDVGTLMSNFQMSYMVGIWAFSFTLRSFDLQRILTIPAGLVAILMCVLNTGTPAHVVWSILALGFFSSAIYTTIITLGSQQTKVPSPELVNFVLTCGTIGIILTFVVTGPIVEYSSPQAAPSTASDLYTVVLVMRFLLGLVSRYRQYDALTSH